jgi:hypothetical protein
VPYIGYIGYIGLDRHDRQPPSASTIIRGCYLRLPEAMPLRREDTTGVLVENAETSLVRQTDAGPTSRYGRFSLRWPHAPLLISAFSMERQILI